MLKIPTSVSSSSNSQDIKIDILCDWIEGNILFEDHSISSTDIIDTLTEEYMYFDQDSAARIVADAWSELRRRLFGFGDKTTFVMEGLHIKRKPKSWRDTPAHSFCVLLSLTKWYPGWGKQFGSDYNEQGELFEELTKEAVATLFSGWQVHTTGWSRKQTTKLGEVVKEVATLLGEAEGKIERWTKPTANDAGLDLLFFRPFPDGRVGIPTYLMQCASGGNWEGKLHTPNLKIWTRLVEFTAFPKKAFATPFAFLEDDFRIHCNLVDGLLLDRYRLLSAAIHKKSWVSNELKQNIVAWAAPRISKLPRRDF